MRMIRRAKIGCAIFCLIQIALAAATTASQSAWQKQASGTMTRLHAIYFLDEQRGFAAGGNGVVLVTEDGGVTWHLMRRPNDDTVRDLLFIDGRIGWMLVERNLYAQRGDEPRSYFWRTEDGGKTWLHLNPVGVEAVTLTRLVFADEAHGWTFGEAGTIYAIRDGGRSWTRQFAPTRHLLLAGASYDAQRAWIVGANSTALYTTDGGDNWQLGFVPETGVRLNGVNFVDERHGWAVGNGGRIFMTSNGGKAWRRQNSNTNADLFDVRFLNLREGWVVGANGTILHTSDGGTTWQVVPSGTNYQLERLCFAANGRGWAIGFGGTILAYR